MEQLEKVSSFQEFVQIFSQFGNEMVEFAHLTGDRQNVRINKKLWVMLWGIIFIWITGKFGFCWHDYFLQNRTVAGVLFLKPTTFSLLHLKGHPSILKLSLRNITALFDLHIFQKLSACYLMFPLASIIVFWFLYFLAYYSSREFVTRQKHLMFAHREGIGKQ